MNHKMSRQSMYVCSFCGKNQDQVQRLIAGPKMVYVCKECIGRFDADVALQSQGQGTQRCSFCGKAQKKVAYLVLGPGNINICEECIVLCQEIIAEEGRLHS